MNTSSHYDYGSNSTFISTWKTDNAGVSTATQIKLPLNAAGGRYNFKVYWGEFGDTDYDTITTWNQAETTHTYTVAGTYTIRIRGLCVGWSFNNLGDKLKLLRVLRWGSVKLGNVPGHFQGCTNLKMDTITDLFNTNGTTIFSGMFAFCPVIDTIGRLNNWDTSKVTSMSTMFDMPQGANSTTGSGIFNQNIGNWDTGKVTSFNAMFHFTNVFNNGGSPDIGNWNMSSATDTGGMFSRANAFNQPIANWERVGSTMGNVITMLDMFSSSNRSYGFNQPIGNWNVSNVTNMGNMFYRSCFNQDISNWNISKVTNFSSLFGINGSFAVFSVANLDLMYNKWSLLLVKPNVTISFSSKRSTASDAGKAILQGPPNNWIITDGGL